MAIADEHAFAELTERHRRELRVHCYRMLGSFDESEDLVQETLLRAWRGRESFEGRSTLRAWLYRIATNACLDFLARHPRRPRPYQVPPAVEPSVPAEPPPEIPWLQPFPDRLLEPVASADAEPEAAVVAKETIELVFLAAIQHLPPKQRAALILREVMGWSATEMAEALWFVGRDAIGAMIAELFDPGSPRCFGDWRAVPTRANRQPAYAGYVRRPGTTTYRAQVLDAADRERPGGGDHHVRATPPPRVRPSADALIAPAIPFEPRLNGRHFEPGGSRCCSRTRTR